MAMRYQLQHDWPDAISMSHPTYAWPGTVAQRALHDLANGSSRVMALAAQSHTVRDSPRVQVQHGASELANAPTRYHNDTGLPDQLKAGIESLSGMSMDNVKVHYNSSRPEQLHAHAYAHGSDIHLAPGQEKHLPHEAWHPAQQAKGRVRPTFQLRGQIPLNDDLELEREADVMGARASQLCGGAAPTRQPLEPLYSQTRPTVQLRVSDAKQAATTLLITADLNSREEIIAYLKTQPWPEVGEGIGAIRSAYNIGAGLDRIAWGDIWEDDCRKSKKKLKESSILVSSKVWICSKIHRLSRLSGCYPAEFNGTFQLNIPKTVEPGIFEFLISSRRFGRDFQVN